MMVMMMTNETPTLKTTLYSITRSWIWPQQVCISDEKISIGSVMCAKYNKKQVWEAKKIKIEKYKNSIIMKFGGTTETHTFYVFQTLFNREWGILHTIYLFSRKVIGYCHSCDSTRANITYKTTKEHEK